MLQLFKTSSELYLVCCVLVYLRIDTALVIQYIYISVQLFKYRVLNLYYHSIQFRDQIRFKPREKKINQQNMTLYLLQCISKVVNT